MASNKKKPTWAAVKAILNKKEKADLLKLVADLYSFSNENKSFINSRYFIGCETLKPYKRIISESLYPDVYNNEYVSLSTGRKAISDHFKATKDKVGQLELMMYYLEMGNKFTVDFGDIDESFYSSLESMLDRILNTLEKQSVEVQKQYLSRLEIVVESARDMGWGYDDYTSAEVEDFITNSVAPE